MREVNIALQKANNGTASPLIYGQFIEHLGDCINGGIYDETSPLSDEKHIRKDVLEKVKRLAPPIIRFPGGTVMCIYHWQDAVGPMEQRKNKKNLIWGGVLRSDFGTAEFVEYCRRVGAEPMICVNMASGTPEEAGAWVEYCNGTGDTYWANLRRQHGYEEPFHVKYWCVGNECYAEPDIGIQHDVKVYIRDAKEFIKFMKLSDPAIELVIVGSDDTENWNKPVLKELGDFADYFSWHFYAAENDLGLYGPFQGEEYFAKKLDELCALLDELPEQPIHFSPWYRFPPRKGKMKLMIDEWNIWQFRQDELYGLHMVYNWRDAVWVSSMLNRFIQCPGIAGCNMAQLCNIIAPIVADGAGSYVQTIYAPMEIYRREMYGERMMTEIGGQYTVNGGRAGEIDAISCAAVQREGKVRMALVNRDFEGDIVCTLPMNMTGTCLTARDPRAVNTRDADCVEQTAVQCKAGCAFTLPRGSVCILREV